PGRADSRERRRPGAQLGRTGRGDDSRRDPAPCGEPRRRAPPPCVVEPVSARFPTGSCDTHVHVYDCRYPTAPTSTLFPRDASVDDYRAVQAAFGLRRVVLVQPSTYGLDNSCQIEAAARFGD